MFFRYLDYFFVEQFVIPGETEAKISTTLNNYVASNAVDGNVAQEILYCSHTNEKSTITEAWLRIKLRNVFSLKFVKFWYSKYEMF